MACQVLLALLHYHHIVRGMQCLTRLESHQSKHPCAGEGSPPTGLLDSRIPNRHWWKGRYSLLKTYHLLTPVVSCDQSDCRAKTLLSPTLKSHLVGPCRWCRWHSSIHLVRTSTRIPRIRGLTNRTNMSIP